MKRVFLIIMLFVTSVSYALEAEAEATKSETIVFISGKRFYVHNVASGETLYSLSKLYGVETSVIVENNASIENSQIKSGEVLKIPVGESPKREVMEDRKFRKNFDVHRVAEGETLYAISRRYKISVATIIEDNPNIDPVKLSIRQEILIRKKAAGKSSGEDIIDELTAYKDNMNRVAPKGYRYHVVSPKETLYSLLRTTNMSRKEFSELNNMSSGDLKVGAIVVIRDVAQSEQSAENEQDSEKNEGLYGGYTPREVEFTALRRRDTLNVSLLLPLTTKTGTVIPIFEEFYKGFLLGVEDLKSRGLSVNVCLFNTKRDRGEMTDIVRSEEFRRSNLIVGPVYEELLSEVLPFAESRKIPVVSPLATLQSSNSGALFQMAPIPDHKYDKIGGLLADSVQVTLIYTDKTDSLYEAEVKSLLGDRPYRTHIYEYEHATAVAERERKAKRLNKEVEPSPSDLSPLIHGDSLRTIFIMPDNETDVDRVLSALASAEIGLRSRSLTVGDFTVVSNSKWNRYTNIDRAMLFRDRVTSFTSYHAKRDGGVIRLFDSRYAGEFGELPSLYSYRGYDIAKMFGEGMFSDIEYGMEGRTFTPLQTTYRFQKMRGKESRANQNWMRVNYKNNFTITLE